MGSNKKNGNKREENQYDIDFIHTEARKLSNKTYEKELRKLQLELVKLQSWVKKEGKKIVVLFEGRDSAGKGGTIKRITECLNHRICNVVALGVPTETEKTEWYFQRYVKHLPSAGEIVLFDRSWYNRAGVEKVMGFCNDSEYDEFMEICPGFEEAIINSGILLFKYWLLLSPEEQEVRFQERLENPMKQWKISPMDMEARRRWYDYSRARNEMFRRTNTRHAPWYVIRADDKKKARLNCIRHLLSKIPYKDYPMKKMKFPKLQKKDDYQGLLASEVNFIPEKY